MIFRYIAIIVISVSFGFRAAAAQQSGVADELLDQYIGELLAVNDSSEENVLVVQASQPTAVSADETVAIETVVVEEPNAVDPNAVKKELAALEDAKVSVLLAESRRLREKLHQSTLSSFSGDREFSQADELMDAIAQLNLLRIEERPEVAQSAIEQVQMPIDIDPQEVISDAVKVENETMLAIENAKQGIVAKEEDAAIEMAQILPIDDADVTNAFELAEMLFKMDQTKLALKYYRVALYQFDQAEKKDQHGRDWAIFQIGNCLFKNDPKLALLSYDQLLEEHENSNWGQLARSKKQLLEWIVAEEPLTIIEKTLPVANNN
jgi:tetratricopeptide (TPR) repeat protein